MAAPAVSLAGAVVALSASAFVWHVVLPTLAMRWRLRGVPGPITLPFIGNLVGMSTLGFHEFGRWAWKRWGTVAAIWFGGNPWVIVSDAELARKVMFRFINRHELPQVLDGEQKEIEVKGLIFAKDLHWRIARSVLSSTFS
jgi:hypothetical protein